MPRIEFANITESVDWIRSFVINSDKKYIAYCTKNNELILVPTKSTRPIVYALIKNVNRKEVTILFKNSTIPVYNIEYFEWNIERGLSKSE